MKKEKYSADIAQTKRARHGLMLKRTLLALAIAGVAASSTGCIVRDDEGHHHWRWHHNHDYDHHDHD